MADPGEGPGGVEPLPLFPLFLDQIEARRAEKIYIFFVLAKLLFSNLDCLGNISFLLLFFGLLLPAFSQRTFFKAVDQAVPITIWIGTTSLGVEIIVSFVG